MRHRAILYNIEHDARSNVIYYTAWSIEQSFIILSMAQRAMFYICNMEHSATIYHIEHGAEKNFIYYRAWSIELCNIV